MEDRIKLIYGKKEIDNIDKTVLIEDASQISIFYVDNIIVLAVYGNLLLSKPNKVINIKLNEFASEFSTEREVLRFIKTGEQDDKLKRQIEIINACLYKNQIKKKVSEIEILIKQGKTHVEVKCPQDYEVAIKNYVEKKHSYRATKRGSKIILTKN